MSYWLKTKTIIAAVTLFYASQSLAAELYVISNSDLNIDASALKGVFLGETQFSGSTKLEVTDNSSAQTVFLTKVMGMDKVKYDSLWIKKSFRDGLSQPPVRNSDSEVIEFVKKTSGAIGYVISAPSNVKVIQQF